MWQQKSHPAAYDSYCPEMLIEEAVLKVTMKEPTKQEKGKRCRPIYTSSTGGRKEQPDSPV